MEHFFDRSENLETAKKLLEAVSQTTDDTLFILDVPNCEYRYFGSLGEEFLLRDVKQDCVPLKALQERVHPADRLVHSRHTRWIREGVLEKWNFDFRLLHRNGKYVWINSRGLVFFDEEKKAHMAIGRLSAEALQHLYNPLTVRWNKNRLRQDLQKNWENWKGYFLLIDINSLASINLLYGREYGDKILVEIGSCLEKTGLVKEIYHMDHNYYGAVILSSEVEIVSRVFAELEQDLKEKCSFTAAAIPMDSTLFFDGSGLMDCANLVLNKAKRDHRTGLVFFSEKEVSERVANQLLLSEWKLSSENGFEGFSLVYQPQVKSETHELVGMEALLRYHRDDGSPVYPDVMIPLLEQSGLIVPVGMWVLKTALAACKKWRKQYPDLRVSVNFSSLQMEDSAIGEKIVSLLRKMELPGEALNIELTESVQLHQSETMRNQIKYLKAYRVGLSIDDFGTGYSNFGSLKDLDVDEIKVDRSFVSGLEWGSYNYNLIKNVFVLAKRYHIAICCEGVEEKSELAVLEQMKPDLLQGYLFDRPLTAPQVELAYMVPDAEEFRRRKNRFSTEKQQNLNIKKGKEF